MNWRDAIRADRERYADLYCPQWLNANDNAPNARGDLSISPAPRAGARRLRPNPQARRRAPLLFADVIDCTRTAERWIWALLVGIVGPLLAYALICFLAGPR